MVCYFHDKTVYTELLCVPFSNGVPSWLSALFTDAHLAGAIRDGSICALCECGCVWLKIEVQTFCSRGLETEAFQWRRHAYRVMSL
jgi:hypothetical protein